jgi:DNA-binding transcriptional LysR family regulator
MDAHQLKTLLHVGELGSLSRAATRLGVGQPSLSRQIRLLEDELGAPLFERHGRGMHLTELGREVWERAAVVLAQMDDIRRLAEQGETRFRGRVRFGMTPTVAEIMTVPLARAVGTAHPALNLCLTSAFSGYLEDWLQRGELDGAVSYNPAMTRSLRVDPILMEDLLFVAPADRALSLERPVPFAALADERLVLPSPLHGLRSIADQCARRAGIVLAPTLEADSFSGLIDLVREGFGATILPLAPIYDAVKRGALSASPLIDPAPKRRLVMLFAADRPVSPAARHVAEVFTAAAQDLVRRKVWAGELLSAA